MQPGRHMSRRLRAALNEARSMALNACETCPWDKTCRTPAAKTPSIEADGSTRNFGEDEAILTSIFFKGVVQPPSFLMVYVGTHMLDGQCIEVMTEI